MNNFQLFFSFQALHGEVLFFLLGSLQEKFLRCVPNFFNTALEICNTLYDWFQIVFSFVIFQIPANILLVKNCSAGKFKIRVHFLSEASQAEILNP